jgi:AraC-like DNA-binding protein
MPSGLELREAGGRSMDARTSFAAGDRGTISARMFPEGIRLNMWRELFGRQFLRLDIDPLDDEPFRFDADYVSLPGLSLSSGTISSVSCTRTSQLVDDRNDDIVLLIPQAGKVEAHERGKEAVVSSGGALVRRSCETGKTNSTSGHYLTLSVPQAAVAMQIGDFSHFGFAVLPDGNQTLRLLRNYLQMLLDCRPVPAAPDEAGQGMGEMIARHVHEMIGLLLGTSRDEWEDSGLPGGGLFAARIAAIRSEVSRNATNPDFSVHDVAHQLGISPGYIRKLLASGNQRFTDLVRSTRLDLAHRMLLTPHRRHVDITQIAYESGFNDISYFNRCFRQRFGATPSEVRNGLTASNGD